MIEKKEYQYHSLTYLIPAILGIGIGALIISNFYIVNFLSSFSDYGRFLRVVPLEISFIFFLAVIASGVMVANIHRIDFIIRNREKVFSLLLLIGLHTSGLLPGKLDSSDILFGLFVILWLIYAFTSKGYKIVSSPFHYLNFALFFFAVLSAVNGGIFTAINMMPLVKAIVTAFLIIDLLRRKELIIFFIKALLVVTTGSAIIAIMQEIVFLSTGTILAWYDTKFLVLLLESTDFGTFLRVPAFTSLHLFLANYLVISLLVGFNSLLYFRRTLGRGEKVFLIASMVCMTIALVLTFSKTNMLGLSIGILISVYMRWPTRLIHLLTLMLFILATTYIAGWWDLFYEYLLSNMELQGDIGQRIDLMRKGIEGFIDKHPFIGAGVGRGKDYTFNIWGWGVHNAFIGAADDVGIMGFLLFSSLFLYVLLRLIKGILLIKDSTERAVLKILLAGLIAYFVNIQFQPDFLSYYNWIYLGFVESAVIVFLKGREKPLNHT